MKNHQPPKVGEYWEKHILSWEESAYYRSHGQKEHLRFLDRISTLLRRDKMYERMHAALDLLAPHVRGLTVLDVGCGSGRFASQLIEIGASRVIGVDVAASAIDMANKRREDAAHLDRIEFFRVDVTHPEASLPVVDLATALGVIEYFDSESLAVFLGNLKATYFFFDFPLRKKKSPTKWVLRKLYLSVKQCPGVYFYSLEEFSHAATRLGFTDVRLAECSGFDFVTNLPKNSGDQSER